MRILPQIFKKNLVWFLTEIVITSILYFSAMNLTKSNAFHHQKIKKYMIGQVFLSSFIRKTLTLYSLMFAWIWLFSLSVTSEISQNQEYLQYMSVCSQSILSSFMFNKKSFMDDMMVWHPVSLLLLWACQLLQIYWYNALHISVIIVVQFVILKNFKAFFLLNKTLKIIIRQS